MTCALYKAVATTTIRLRFDGRSTVLNCLLKVIKVTVTLTRAADPLAAVTSTYLLCPRPHRAEALSDDARLTTSV